MNSITQNKRYCPHEIKTKVNSVKLYRIFVRFGFRKKVESIKKKSKHMGKYDMPTELCVKWQLDVKYVPTA